MNRSVMKITAIVITIAVLLVQALAFNIPQAKAATYSVTSGQKISDIFNNNNLQPGDVVNVYEGTYNEVVWAGTDDVGEGLLIHPNSYAIGISLSNSNRIYFPTGAAYDTMLNTLNTNQSIIGQYFAYVYRSVKSNNGAFPITSVDVSNRYITVNADETFLDEQSDGTQFGLTVAVVRPVILRNAETDPVKQANVVVHQVDWVMFYSESADYILVDGLNFDGEFKTSSAGYIGMQVRGSDYTVIQNCTIKNIKAGDQGGGLLIEAFGTGTNQTSHYNMVLRNKFIDTANEYIYNGAGGHVAADNNTHFTNIIDNDFTQNATYALENVIEIKEYNKGQTVEGNYIHDIEYIRPWGNLFGIGNLPTDAGKTTDVLVYGNKINNIGNLSNSATENISIFYLAGVGNTKIFNNVVSNVSLPASGKAVKTIYYENSGSTVAVFGNNYFSNNTLYNNEAITFSNGTSMTGYMYFNNNIISDTDVVFEYTHAKQVVDYNLYSNNISLGITPAAHDLLNPANPLSYASTNVSDYNFLNLSTGSSGIDQGTAMSYFGIDYERSIRPTGTNWEIGAFEYGTGGITPTPTSTGSTPTSTPITPTSTPTATSTPVPVIFSDDFEASLAWTTSGDILWYTGSPKNGAHDVRLRVTGSIEKIISTVGYDTLSVSFYMGANSLDNTNENMQALWYDGSAWTVLKQINNGDPEEDNLLHHFTYSLPSAADNNPSFALKFKLNGSGTGDYGFVDDVMLSGTPNSLTPTPVTPTSTPVTPTATPTSTETVPPTATFTLTATMPPTATYTPTNTTPPSSNLITNPGFEDGAIGWENWGNSSIVTTNQHSGSRCLRVGTGAGGRAQQISGVVPGQTYIFSAWAKMSTTSSVWAEVSIQAYNSSGGLISGSYQYLDFQGVGTTYTQKSLSYTMPVGTAYVQVFVWKDSTTYLYVDDLSLVP